MLLDPLPLSQTVTPRTPSLSNVTYFMDGPLLINTSLYMHYAIY